MRFGIILTPRDGRSWVQEVRGAESAGYRTVLLPDTLFTASPFPALAAAAAVTETMRLRPNVLAAPLRTTAATVREVAALQQLSDGRFELGIGVGRPDAQLEAERLGGYWGTAGHRREWLLETVAAVRAEVDPVPEIVIAASGPRMLEAAAAVADRILLAAPPQATEADLATMVRVVRDATDRPVRFSQQLVGIGDRLPYWTSTKLGLTPAGLRAEGAAGMFDADPDAATALLEHRLAAYGIDELIVPGELSDAAAPLLPRYVATVR
ncbi:LLM class flavin-dependent oxidoreductase [Nocardia sp. NPDC059180]|uniref:LLM class flavin-dependent oxidoreductase n=1 Tax=Nocardia sp. NPDC059180 TaxID=3346761 RepID=UPI00367D9E32